MEFEEDFLVLLPDKAVLDIMREIALCQEIKELLNLD
jgi:hypothetical protein